MAKGQTLAEAAAGLGIPLWVANAELRRSGLTPPSAAARARSRAPSRAASRQAPAGPARLDDFGLLLALRLMAHELGAERSARGPVPVSMGDWNARRDRMLHPTAQAMATRFGGWGVACERAGVPARETRRRLGRVRRWTDEDCLAAMRQFLTETTAGTTGSDYTAWAATRDVPSLPTVTARFGGWPQARERARG